MAFPAVVDVAAVFRNNVTTIQCSSGRAGLLGLRVRIPPGHGYLSLVSVAFCQVEVSATGRSLVQRTPTDCGVSERDSEASTMRRP